MKLPVFPKKALKIFRPKLILAIIFLALLAYEVYVLYYKVYENLSTGVDEISVNTNIVRLDLNNYQKMLELLDRAKSFKPSTITLNNPFD